jgi:hypothetical protein
MVCFHALWLYFTFLQRTDTFDPRYPRLHIGHHWQDMSIPVYCYLEQSASGIFSEIKWAIRPLGDPLKGKPSWINFTLPINSIINQIACLSYGMKQELMSSMKVSLTTNYLAQMKFDADALVYREEDLEKRSLISAKGQDQRSESCKRELHAGTSRAPIWLEEDGRLDNAAKRMVMAEGTAPLTSAPLEDPILLQLNDSRRGRRVEDDCQSNSAKRMKTKDEKSGGTPTHINQPPCGPRQWSYFDQYDKRKPSNLRR